MFDRPRGNSPVANDPPTFRILSTEAVACAIRQRKVMAVGTAPVAMRISSGWFCNPRVQSRMVKKGPQRLGHLLAFPHQKLLRAASTTRQTRLPGALRSAPISFS